MAISCLVRRAVHLDGNAVRWQRYVNAAATTAAPPPSPCRNLVGGMFRSDTKVFAAETSKTGVCRHRN